jgi:adenylyl cyclase-associated protein
VDLHVLGLGCVCANPRLSEPLHVEWVKSYHAILEALEEYIKKYHQMGVTWNAKGVDASQLLASKAAVAPAAPAPSGGAPPPPPPPPPPGPAPVLGLDGTFTPKPAGGDINAIFDQLNRGEAVTAGLRKVDKSQMTHKNPELRGSSIVPANVRPGSSGSIRGKSPAPPPRAKPASLSLSQKKPPKMELEGMKWVIENYENEQNLVVAETERNQSVFLFRCKNTTVQIKGKVNQITINECTKTNVVADSLVSGIEVIKSNRFAIQVMHHVPTIQVDQCDGGTIYVSEESLGVEIFTSKTSAVNVYIPGAGDDGDYAERAVPEQLRHTIKDGQLVSEIVEHAG